MKTKKDPRHQARRLAVLILFEWTFHKKASLSDHAGVLVEEGSVLLQQSNKAFKFDNALLTELVEGIPPRIEEIDTIVSKCAPEWPLNQISRVDLSILRISIFELLYRDDTPTKVAIDEAVELAKEFGGTNSSKFVNGVLGTVVKDHIADTPSQE